MQAQAWLCLREYPLRLCWIGRMRLASVGVNDAEKHMWKETEADRRES